MGIPKVTGFLISFVLIALFAGTITYFLSGFTSNYTDITYDNSTLSSYQVMDKIEQNVQEIEKNSSRKIEPNTLDILGSYLSSGYDAIKLSFSSISLFKAMVDDTMKDSNIAGDSGVLDNSFANLLRTALISIVLILFFVGIIISILVKREKI